MPDILPTINNEPAQGIQALLDTVYLWNPDVANGLIEKVNELLEELGDLSNVGAIKPYSELVAPVPQYLPMSYNDGVYVANEEMTELPATPDLTKWMLIATKVDEQALEQQISSAVGGEADLRQQADTALQSNIDAEERARIAADQGLQTQIDAISAASDVKDIVGTYQELENYDTSTLGNNDIIKVLQDETQEDATTYYRWVAAEDEFQLIGEEGPYYTRAQTDAMLEEKQDIMQFSTMPESADYPNRIIEYTGETKEDTPASAIAEQTVGSSLSNVAVNLETFEEKENPVDAETVSFVCTGVSGGLSNNPQTQYGVTMDIDVDTFAAKVANEWPDVDLTTASNIQIDCEHVPGTDHVSHVIVYVTTDQTYSKWIYSEDTELDELGDWGIITLEGEPTVDNWFPFTFSPWVINATWEKDGEVVDPAEYGVTYDGAPDVDDEITISYTPEVVGRTKGYFYASAPVLEPAQATVAQTVGGDSLIFETVAGDMTVSGTPQALVNLLSEGPGWSPTDIPSTGTLTFTRSRNDDIWLVDIEPAGWSDTLWQDYLESMGFVFSGTPAEGDTVVGNYVFSLSDLTINTATFVEAEHPTGDETVDFVATVYNDFQLSPTSFEVEGGTLTVDPDTFLQAYRNYYGDPDNVYLFEVEVQSGNFYMIVYYTDGDFDTWFDPAEFGFSYTGDLSELTTTTICNINCTEPGARWYKNGSLVDIAEYGISYDREPQDGDTITVTYTAPFISGYAWEQINVQPGGGAGGGIEWKTIVDIPTNYTGNSRPAPEYTIAGGLPNGDYEFYFQVLCRIGNNVPTGVATYKVQIRVNNDNSVIYGRMGYVIDGQWLPSDEYMVQDTSMWGLFWNSDGDLKIYRNATPWATNFTRNQARDGVPGCFKLSAIKNMNTGEEYIATGELNSTGSISSGWQYSGEVYARAIQQQPYVPVYQQVNSGNLNGSVQYIMLAPGLEKDGNQSGAREIDVSLKATPPHTGTFHTIIENSAYSSTVHVLEATGVFEDMEIGANGGETLLYLPTIPQGEEITYTVFIGAKGSSQAASAYSRWNSEISNFVPYGISTVGYPVLANTLGAVDQYKGVTNASYTNGYFYKATGTLVHVPSSITFTTNHSDFGITVADSDALVQWFVDNAGWARADTEQLLIDNTYWSFNYDTSGGEVTWVYWNAFGEETDPSLCSLFTVTYTGASTGVLEFQADSAFTPSQDEVQNGHWEQVDVQPAGVSYTAGTGIDITSGVISVITPVTSTAVGGLVAGNGYSTTDTQQWITRFGRGTQATGDGSSAFGNSARATGSQSTALGSSAYAYANYAIQLGIGTNSTANTFKVGLSNNSNYELLSADGTIPEARLADTTNAAQGQVLTLDSNLNAVWQAGSGGGLPSQTGNAGKFLTTDGTDASWSDKPLTNYAINNGLGIHGGVDGVVSVTGTYAVGIGTGNVTSSDTRTIAIGYGSVARGNKAIAINGQATAVNAIQIGAASGAYGYYTNSDANTFKVGNENGNFEMMSADGTIPTDRFTTTPSADGTYYPTLSISSGTATRSWGTISALQNAATGTNSIIVGGVTSNTSKVTVLGIGAQATSSGAVAIGKGANASGSGGIAIGELAVSPVSLSVSIGSGAQVGTGSNYGIAIGGNSYVGNNCTYSLALGHSSVAASNAIQIGVSQTTATNSDANTFKVANANGNFEIMSADGTVPHGRLTNAVVPNTVTIAIADWNGGTTCTKTISGLTATSVVWVAPDNASQSDYLTAGVYASAQTTDTITFTATTTPTSALTVNVIYC